MVKGDFSELGEMALNDPVIALFMFLDKFAFSQILGAIAVVVILIFFVTSADSAMIVMDMLSSNGKNVRQRGKMPFGVRRFVSRHLH